MGTAKQDSVILHLEDFEDIDCMKDAEAGKLLKAILCYVSTGALPDKLGVQARTMFGYIRRHIDRDKDKYAEKCRKRAEAGRKGGRPKKEANDSDENQNKAKKANGFFEKQNNPDPEPDPEPEPEPEPDIKPDNQQSDGEPRSAAQPNRDDMYHNKQKRIQFLETMCKLHRSGALTDEDEYRRFADELRMLKG